MHGHWPLGSAASIRSAPCHVIWNQISRFYWSRITSLVKQLQGRISSLVPMQQYLSTLRRQSFRNYGFALVWLIGGAADTVFAARAICDACSWHVLDGRMHGRVPVVTAGSSDSVSGQGCVPVLCHWFEQLRRDTRRKLNPAQASRLDFSMRTGCSGVQKTGVNSARN